jgi:hypothetical protein
MTQCTYNDPTLCGFCIFTLHVHRQAKYVTMKLVYKAPSIVIYQSNVLYSVNILTILLFNQIICTISYHQWIWRNQLIRNEAWQLYIWNGNRNQVSMGGKNPNNSNQTPQTVIATYHSHNTHRLTYHSHVVWPQSGNPLQWVSFLHLLKSWHLWESACEFCLLLGWPPVQIKQFDKSDGRW